MKLKIFQSDKGDSMLISSNGTHILVDGGMTNSYTRHVSPALGKLRDNNEELDLVCVSHIDADHISGILKMIEDEVDWRVATYHKTHDQKTKDPKSIRPPKIKEVWHNAFHESQKDNVGEIENMLAATASILSASSDVKDLALGSLAFSEAQAMQLSRRLKPEQLDIDLNKRFNKKLVMIKPKQKPIQVGNLTLSIIAPFPIDLKNLRDQWNIWLKKSKDRIKDIKDKVAKDDGMLGASGNDMASLLALSKALGNRGDVTPPNLASIMFLVEENGKTLLMTGDGHCNDIRKGLIKIGKLDESKGLHLNALKVQHHGSDHNTDEDFCRLITADNYFFCGNGFKGNPELEVVDAFIKSRVSASPTVRAITKQVGNNFTLWFNSSSKLSPSYKAEMLKVEKLVKARAKSHAQVKFRFMPDNKSAFDITI